MASQMSMSSGPGAINTTTSTSQPYTSHMGFKGGFKGGKKGGKFIGKRHVSSSGREIMGASRGVLRKVFWRCGMKRVNSALYEAMLKMMKALGTDVVRCSGIYADYRRAKTITEYDVARSYKMRNIKFLGEVDANAIP